MISRDKKSSEVPAGSSSLRKRAEKMYLEMAADVPEQGVSPESLHELRVHQIELEMQNVELRAAQAELDASRDLYFDLYDLAPVGYMTINEKGLIIESNLTATILLGVERRSLVKHRPSTFIFKTDQDIYYRLRKQLIETGEPQACELRMVKPNGRTFWVQLEATAAKDESGAPVCRIVLSDISARKQKEAYRGMDREVLQILNESGDRQDFVGRVLATLKARTGFDAVGIRLQDGDDLPYFVQDGFPEEFLLTENSLLSRTADGALCRDKDGKGHLECPCGLPLTGQSDQENSLFTKGGSCWTNDSRTLPGIPSGEDPRNQCIHHRYASIALLPIRMRDRITGMIQLNDRRKGCFNLETMEILEGIAAHIGEALLRKHTEDKLRATTAIAQDLAIKAESAAAMKSAFLATMSHELRTPLNGVLGFAELLADTPLDDEQKSFVQTITSSGEHLLAIVNDILDFSSIEKGTLAIQCQPFALADLLQTSDIAPHKTAADKGIEFRCEVAAGVPAHIAGDERRIRQVLINLLSNAVKFTATGSVVLRVAPTAEGRFLDFSVEDTGIGISSETISHLFQPFVQADSSMHRPFGGTGLGLAISKRIAEAMGGTLTVISTPHKGSTFTFRLPLEISTPSSAPVASAPRDLDSALPSGTLVLVVEDDQSSSMLAGKMLLRLGYRAEFAADGAEALKAFVPGKFSAILMDIAMPVMDGLEATKKIREVETGPRVPIIALTANVMRGDREKCLAAGMDDFLTKPFKRSEFAAKLANINTASSGAA